ncbi:Uncharacterized protein HZ326_22720 [Fusarium oxysporum f. sp. albedinis]|nr:Uncharacterized protein HZ326_22720 [Fusarium oxysporum f. sp. albedinis]
MWQYADCNFTTLPKNEKKIPGDSDIAGLGVIIAFILPAWVTAGAATIASLRGWEGIDYRLAVGAEDLLGPLCDLQAITGTAIVIAGFSQWNTITFYHRELVLAYWWLTSNSFWMARPAYMYEAVEELNTALSSTSWTKWRAYTRRLLIIVSVFLGISWASLSNKLEADNWNENDPQKCYHFNDITYKSVVMPWVWIAGLGIYQAALIWSFVDRKGTFPGIWKEKGKGLEDFFKDRKNGCSKKNVKISCRSSLAQFLRLLYGRFATFFFWIMFRFVCLARVLISVWSYGDGDVRGFFIVYYVFVIWNTWDIIMLKVMNQPLVEDETKIGFGQVLPLVLLVQILLNIVDIWKGKGYSLLHQMSSLTTVRSSQAERKSRKSKTSTGTGDKESRGRVTGCYA